MKPIYLVHEKHGTHIAYTEAEVKACEATGWRLREPAATKPAAMERTDAEFVAEVKAKRKYTRKAA